MLLAFIDPGILTGWSVIGVIAVTLVLSWLTTHFIEEPLRRAPLTSRRDVSRVLVASTVAMALVAGPAIVEWRTEVSAAQAAITRAAELAAQQERCFGAGAGVDPESCATVSPEALVPAPEFARDDRNDAYLDDCISTTSEPDLSTCQYGVADAPFRVAMVGDSHAVNWFPAFQRLAEERNWSLTTHFKSACPESAAFKRNSVAEAETSCAEWNRQMATGEHIIEPYDLVVVSYSAASDSYDSPEIAIDGFLGAWQKYIDGGSTIVVMADNARNTPEVVECLVANADDPLACSVPLEVAYPGTDNMIAAAQRIPENAVVVTTEDVFCEGDRCDAVIGGVVVYRDSHHLTNTFATTLAPIIGERLDAALAALPAR